MTDVRAVQDWTIDAVSADAMVLWCEMLRDDNPIHLDPAAAQSLGFGPRTVNPGPANLAYLITLLMRDAPLDDVAAIDARFLGHALAGDRLCASGEPVPGIADAYDTQLSREGTPLTTARITMRGKSS